MGRKLYQNKYRTQTLRIKWWDYSEDGDYFITICTRDNGNVLGRLSKNDINLNVRGRIVKKYLQGIPDHFGNVKILSWIIMPDHVHLLLRIRNKRKLVAAQHCCVATNNTDNTFSKISGKINSTLPKEHYAVKNEYSETQPYCVSTNNHEQNICNNYVSRTFYRLKPRSIPVIIRSFKSICTRTIHSIENNNNFKWQKSFYDEVIFNDQVLQNVEFYIRDNPKTNTNKENPINPDGALM
jgi:REP element-mobilizing transposase RayT